MNLNLGDLEMIWNSLASYPSRYTTQPRGLVQKLLQRLLQRKADVGFKDKRTRPKWTLDDYSAAIDGLPKGWNEEWGSLQLPCSRARIGKLLDRDYVWAVTQTMVSFENLALWAVHTVRSYKVYPGFWGRRLLSFTSRVLGN